MVSRRALRWIAILMAAIFVTLSPSHAQTRTGSLGGTVTDQDFDAPIAGATVQILETRQSAETDARGAYRFDQVAAGVYTLVVSKGSDYSRVTRTGVAVQDGQYTDLDVELEPEYVTLDVFVAQPTLGLIAGGVESLDVFRDTSTSIVDLVGQEDFAKQGVSDVAQGLAAVPGASVAADATAVIRGLPDRYVPSLVNGVRLPSANEDKRAVELDQFPTNIVESIAVSKTFTPDNQGDASGGTVDIKLRSIPKERIFNFNVGTSYNTQVTNEKSFILYDGAGVGALGRDAGNRRAQLDSLGEDWEGAVGVSPFGAPRDYKLATSFGDSFEFDNGVKVGGFLSLFYERDSSFFDNGRNDSLWIDRPEDGLIPQERGNDPAGKGNDFQTALFDLVQGSQQVQWGGTASFGVEFNADHKLSLQYLYSHTAEDTATLAEDTRGKLFFYPDYDPNDPASLGNIGGNRFSAPYVRTHTLEYTERTIGTLQLRGEHTFRLGELELGEALKFKDAKLDWTVAQSFSNLDQPDKRLFGTLFRARGFEPGVPGFTADRILDPLYQFFRPADSINLGNLQRIFKTIDEDGTQGALNLTFPFEQWTGDEGAFKFGLFDDTVERDYRQENFSNTGPPGAVAGDPNNEFQGGFGEFWTNSWGNETHVINEALQDVDYDGSIDIQAWYAMVDVPLNDRFKLVGGARFESTDIGVTLTPEAESLWVPPGGTALAPLLPGDGEVDISQRNVLPSINAIYDVTDQVTLRGAVSRTVARQTFKELTPIVQQEFLGGPVFIGNPDLEIAELENYDLRVDYRPTPTTLLSASYFYKDVENPIENIQRVVGFGFTTPVNYPEGTLKGFELEARQELGEFFEFLDGFSIGANFTAIDSEVTFPDVQLAEFEQADVGFSQRTRDATNAPEHLYNLFLNYNIRDTGTQVGLFYTVQGDTLIAGDSTSQFNYIPAIYQLEYGTLNITFAQRLTQHLNLRIAARNITNESITEVYRSTLLDDDVTFTTFTRGVEYSVGLSASISF